MKYAGIDIGTTTISAVLIDGSGRELCHYTVPNDSALHGENSWERLQDAERITEICQDLINRIRRDAGTFNGHSALAGIGLTGQMHGIVYFDQNGRAVSPLITWQDGRGDAWLSGTEDSHRGDAAFCGNAYGGGDADTACGRIRKTCRVRSFPRRDLSGTCTCPASSRRLPRISASGCLSASTQHRTASVALCCPSASTVTTV